ncbi:MAG: hypothetical protein AB7D07_10300 [Desulfovibrionaceae bacterium]
MQIQTRRQLWLAKNRGLVRILGGLVVAAVVVALAASVKVSFFEAEAAPHMEERTAPGMAQGSHAAGQSDGLKMSVSTSGIGISGSPKEVGQALTQGMQGLAEVANDVDNYLKYEADRRRRWAEGAKEFKAKVRKAMEVRRTDRAFWDTLPLETRFQLLVGISYEQKGMTQEQREELKKLYEQGKGQYSKARMANLAVFAGERYGFTGPGRSLFPFYNTVIASN